MEAAPAAQKAIVNAAQQLDLKRNIVLSLPAFFLTGMFSTATPYAGARIIMSVELGLGGE